MAGTRYRFRNPVPSLGGPPSIDARGIELANNFVLGVLENKNAAVIFHNFPGLGRACDDTFFILFDYLNLDTNRRHAESIHPIYLHDDGQDDWFSMIFDYEEGFSVECLKSLIKLRKDLPFVKALVRHIGFADDEIFYPLQAADMFAYAYKRSLQGTAHHGHRQKWQGLQKGVPGLYGRGIRQTRLGQERRTRREGAVAIGLHLKARPNVGK